MTRTLLAGTTANSRQPWSCSTVAPTGISETREATTVPIAAPLSGSPTTNGGTYDLTSFIRPRMYGSTDISVFLTRISPSPGGPTSAVAKAKLSPDGSPLGRLASRISRLRTVSFAVVMDQGYRGRAGAPAARSLALAVADSGELVEEFLLFVGEVGGELSDQPDVLVAVAGVLELRHPLAGEPQHLVVLRPGRDRHRDVAVHRWDAHLGAQDQVVDADRQVEVEIVALALVP